MATLKQLRVRISSVKQTQKITSAMKMVAASKLRRAQEAAVAARPYAERMDRMVVSLAGNLQGREEAPALLVGTGKEEVHLLVVATADRGLCGGFNSSIVRAAKARIRQLERESKIVKLYCVGRKGRDQLRREYGRSIVGHTERLGGKFGPGIDDAKAIAQKIIEMFEAGEFDVCTIVYNRFKSVISQVVTTQQLLPYVAARPEEAAVPDLGGAIYEFEPDEGEILERLLPENLGVQIFRAVLENAASEQGARMTAMDNATRNAGDMIDRLTLLYNRSRQAAITKELIEIISGAEAL